MQPAAALGDMVGLANRGSSGEQSWTSISGRRATRRTDSQIGPYELAY